MYFLKIIMYNHKIRYFVKLMLWLYTYLKDQLLNNLEFKEQQKFYLRQNYYLNLIKKRIDQHCISLNNYYRLKILNPLFKLVNLFLNLLIMIHRSCKL